jgi:hypothetical protein
METMVFHFKKPVKGYGSTLEDASFLSYPGHDRWRLLLDRSR